MGLILNTEVRLRKVANKIFIYSIEPFTYSPSQPLSIHSIFAVLLTMFDGEKSYEDVLRDFCFVIDKEYSAEIVHWVESQLNNIKQKIRVDTLLVEKDTLPLGERKQRYNTMDFAIHANEIVVDNYNLRSDFPLSINFNVTTKCKMSCKYCYHPRYKMDEYISLERLEVLFDECAKNGCESITLSGGDPFNRPDLIQIMKLIKKRGMHYYVSTKSYLDKETCRRLKDEGMADTIQISLDSAKPETAAHLVGMDGGFFERTLETIANLQSSGIRVRIKSVLTRHNIDGVLDLLNLCKNLGIDQLHLSPYRRSIWVHSDNLLPSEAQVECAMEKIRLFKQDNAEPRIIGGDLKPVIVTSCGDNSDIFENRTVCNTGRFGLTMLPNGEVTICEYLQYTPEVILGDLRVQSIEELWNSEQMSKFLSPPPRSTFADGVSCKSCSEDDYAKCHTIYSRCYKDTFAYFRTYHAPDVRCKLAVVDGYRIS